MTDKYWLSKWLDYHDLNSVEEVERSLWSPTVVNSLRQAAAKACRRSERFESTPTDSERFSLLAGKGIDLSGQLACSSDICRRRQVDELFGRVWHYFDRIVVDDNLARRVAHGWENKEAKVKDAFISGAGVLFYLRQIGAEDLVEFRPKPTACTFHWDRHAKEAGLVNLTTQVDAVVELLLPEAQISEMPPESDGTPKVRVKHPLFEISHVLLMQKSVLAEIPGDRTRQAVTIVVRKLIAHLSSDISAAHKYNASLGTVIKAHEMFLHELRPTKVTDVVVNLQLPVLDGLQPWDLIAIRRDESEYFQRFRDSLTNAIGERLRMDPEADPTKLAEELQTDLIEPRLRDISSRLSAAQKLMTKKSSVGLFLGAISTTCGLLSGFDPHVATMGGTGVALACTGTATAKYLDEARDISMDDMYFLWKAAECAPH